MQAHLRHAAAGRRRRDLDTRGLAAEQIPVSRRAAMAEHGAGPAGQDRRESVGSGAERRVANGIDPSMDSMQAPNRQPVLHRGRRQSRLSRMDRFASHATRGW